MENNKGMIKYKKEGNDYWFWISVIYCIFLFKKYKKILQPYRDRFNKNFKILIFHNLFATFNFQKIDKSILIWMK